MRFTYQSGQRPLDGFTIKRGVGQGGFGEVFLAVSDGGKEVALKLLKGHTEVELRGIAHCLNLKHPNLVHLYDLKEDMVGNKWVVMEYVLGESLAAVLNRHPQGLPPALAREWFLNLARGVGYLHDHGVVHRDLKPANVFVEHGFLKVGDYGLCKTISGSQGGAQSKSVGTVHYMAPEVGSGSYTKSIDVYACGVMLYEMLTGKVPFDGETHGEVLMKHLTAAPDLARVPAVFAPVLKRALEKNPAKRYATMTEFARAVEGLPVPGQTAGPVPVAAAVAPPAAERLPPPLPAARPVRPPAPPEPLPAPPTAAFAAPPVYVPPAPLAPQGFRAKSTDLFGAVALAPVVAALCTAPWALFQATVEWAVLGRLFLLTTALAWAVMLVARVKTAHPGDAWARRFWMFGAGVSVGLLAFWLDGWGMPQRIPSGAEVPDREQYVPGLVRMTPEAATTGMRYMLYFGLAVAAGRWWRITDRSRKERFSLFPPLAAAFWGAVLLFLWPWNASLPALGIVPLVLAAVTVQAVSPWVPPPPPPPKRQRLRYA